MKRGFTLMELLAVIVILSVIMIIAVPLVINVISSTKKNASIVSAQYYVDALADAIAKEKMKNAFFDPKECEILESKVYCNKDKVELFVDVSSEKPISGYILFDKEGKIDEIRLEYTTKTIVKGPNGDLVYSYCKLIEDNGDNVLSIGDKYSCQVKDDMEEDFIDGYYFYVLSQNSDGTTNLIMDRNMYYDKQNDEGRVVNDDNKGFVSWYEKRDNSFGPVNALKYLYDITKDWENITNISINYDDENATISGKKGTSGYGGIKTMGTTTIITKKDGTETAKIDNLKARLPMYSELANINCTTISGSCPEWASNYLQFSSTYTNSNNLTNITKIQGYWSLSSYGDYNGSAWDVYMNIHIANHYADRDDRFGIRPVITVKL